MKIGSIVALLLVTTQCSGQHEASSKYDKLFDNKQVSFVSPEDKKRLVDYLSDESNPISLNNIESVIIRKDILLEDYGAVDLIEVSLTKVPGVLKSKHLIVVNHNSKTLEKLNVDYISLLKVSTGSMASYLAVVNNFRGNLELLVYKHSSKKLIPIFVTNIVKHSDCAQYKDGSLAVESKVLEDGKLNIVVSYKALIFCGKDGNASEKPLAERRVTKEVLFKPDIRGVQRGNRPVPASILRK